MAIGIPKDKGIDLLGKEKTIEKEGNLGGCYELARQLEVSQDK